MYAELKDSLDDTCKSDMEKNFDINNWVPKTNIPPPGPRIDMSQYILNLLFHLKKSVLLKKK